MDFDNRKQKTGESFDAYLVAIQQISQDASLTYDHCQACKVACLDRRLAARLISGISDEQTSTKLLEEEKFSRKDHMVEICMARENARRKNQEQWGSQGSVQSVRKHARSQERSKDKEKEPLKEQRCH